MSFKGYLIGPAPIATYVKLTNSQGMNALMAG
jgi:hypothetical protein